jgi:hypothetical protein
VDSQGQRKLNMYMITHRTSRRLKLDLTCLECSLGDACFCTGMFVLCTGDCCFEFQWCRSRLWFCRASIYQPAFPAFLRNLSLFVRCHTIVLPWHYAHYLVFENKPTLTIHPVLCMQLDTVQADSMQMLLSIPWCRFYYAFR